MSKFEARLKKLEQRGSRELFRAFACPLGGWNHSGRCDAAYCACQAARAEHMKATCGKGSFVVIPAEMADV